MSAFFRKTAPPFMRRLLAEPDFGFAADDAFAIFGNAGHESGGFEKLQEMKPVVPGSAGGWGWFQWTGPRRRAFEGFCAQRGLGLASPEAQYQFLVFELRGPEKAAVAAVKKAQGLRAKVEAFERAYERAGVKHYDSRMRWAEIARDAYLASPPAAAPAPKPKETPMAGPAAVLAPALIHLVVKALGKAIDKTANDVNVPVPAAAAEPAAKQALENAAMKELAKTPELQHLANAEPWYQSRVTIGAIVAVIAAIGGIWGWSVSPADQAHLANLLVAVMAGFGGLLAWWGRWRAKKPIGT